MRNTSFDLGLSEALALSGLMITHSASLNVETALFGTFGGRRSSAKRFT
ncbi:hypothetical protein [Agrobacterium tumefaciens]|nr:hypothetical protein [Agrobacterium tumefaciens]NTD87606.1 hypothetical protein [Agrobacterium tumefaciens]NTD92677.1 hypothetical protein [Agrobacterium tumefaciens]NTE15007.1 hypothetical protein [Agrobacterium tumefaciens]NTE29290.1 hypothetical protein [Agrobacterium tumefaciens]NTE41244.1 hypothetical protein [Agrobacterium tumefaciens]